MTSHLTQSCTTLHGTPAASATFLQSSNSGLTLTASSPIQATLTLTSLSSNGVLAVTNVLLRLALSTGWDRTPRVVELRNATSTRAGAEGGEQRAETSTAALPFFISTGVCHASRHPSVARSVAQRCARSSAVWSSMLNVRRVRASRDQKGELLSPEERGGEGAGATRDDADAAAARCFCERFSFFLSFSRALATASSTRADSSLRLSVTSSRGCWAVGCSCGSSPWRRK
mmetsp:Transcript_25079/g.49972  ORF Transcript_25079/g.49972 Transcript_25079/m.49972 type:complete len:230 (-) Transcript_25079:143-832(-)